MTIEPTTSDFTRARELLHQLLEEVSEQEGMLAGGKKLGLGGKAIQGIIDTEVSFGFPDDNLVLLDSELFESLNISLSPVQKRQLDTNGFKFYYMTLTSSIRPKQGATFTQVECTLNFNPGGLNKPIIQAYFPVREWKEVLRLGLSMKLALNGNLDWQAEIHGLAPNQFEQLPIHLQARITNQDDLKAFIAIPNYVYSLGKSEITATGEGNSFCYWHIEDFNLQKAQNLTFVIVFKVPSETKTLDLVGSIRFYPGRSWLINKIRLVFEYLSKTIQTLILPSEEQKESDQLFIGDYEKCFLDLQRCRIKK